MISPFFLKFLKFIRYFVYLTEVCLYIQNRLKSVTDAVEIVLQA